MPELQKTLVLDLAATGQRVAFDCTGYSVGTIQLKLRTGVWGAASVDIKRGNIEAFLAPLTSPISVIAEGVTAQLDLSTKFIGAVVVSPGGPGIIEVVLRAYAP